jgi:hypothetical protein
MDKLLSMDDHDAEARSSSTRSYQIRRALLRRMAITFAAQTVRESTFCAYSVCVWAYVCLCAYAFVRAPVI